MTDEQRKQAFIAAINEAVQQFGFNLVAVPTIQQAAPLAIIGATLSVVPVQDWTPPEPPKEPPKE